MELEREKQFIEAIRPDYSGNRRTVVRKTVTEEPSDYYRRKASESEFKITEIERFTQYFDNDGAIRLTTMAEAALTQILGLGDPEPFKTTLYLTRGYSD